MTSGLLGSSTSLSDPGSDEDAALRAVILADVQAGLNGSAKSLPAWLFYDEAGSKLFEQITELREYYVTRSERSVIESKADQIVGLAAPGCPQTLTIVELGAGTASKTGVLLRAALKRTADVIYQPVDVSESALREAIASLSTVFPEVIVQYQVADYTRDTLRIIHTRSSRTLALYIGSSIGNFGPQQARSILKNLRSQLHADDALLLGTDTPPGPHKTIERLVHAYDDGQGVTASFNRNLLTRLNRELGADFSVEDFEHVARWNALECRIEMHLRSLKDQMVSIPGLSPICFTEGETIHTENSYKFTAESVTTLLGDCGFSPIQSWTDPEGLVALTLAQTI